MWRIVALGAGPAALLGAGSGLFFSHNFVDYQPMGEIYMAQDSMSYTGSPPSYIPQFLGGAGPFYVAPAASLSEPPAVQQPAAESFLAALPGPMAPNVADKAVDATAIEPITPPPNPGPLRETGAALNASFDAQMQSIERDLKRTQDPPSPADPDDPNS